ncbi:conglutin beta 5 [Manduca sexta]|uniref:Uncharacterized protein n=1 Tax=Manduca sexta TaxID=7130 RepID=A0A921YKH6_MANSE|nr:conglutin beta 5 [Manduca sexta]KAG6440949.1 hypothetical protein O3G_MSEX001547 [Manduca sexta]
MNIKNWWILASVLLVSANAGRYDLGPQHFYEHSPPPPQIVPNYETKDVVLYLTPRQVQALEAGGAIVRPQENDSEQLYPAETGQEVQEQEEESEQSHDKETEENLGDQKLTDVTELEEIFRILNKQIEEDARRIHGDSYSGQISQTENGEELEEEDEKVEPEEEKQTGEQDEVYQEEKQIGNVRKIPSRFGVLQRYRLEKYFTPSVSNIKNQQQNDDDIRSLTSDRKSNRFPEVDKKSENHENGIKNNKNRLQDKYKVIPVEEESQEENKQKLNVDLGQEQLIKLLSSVLENNKVVQSIAQHREQLVQKELQLHKGLQELKAAPKHHQRKYETEIERLRANLEAQNALETAEALARSRRISPKGGFNKNNFELDNGNRESLPSPLRSFELRGSQQLVPYKILTPISGPVVKSSRTVPVKINKQIPVSSNPKELKIIRHLR